MPATGDGPSTKQFKPLTLRGNADLARLRRSAVAPGRGAD